MDLLVEVFTDANQVELRLVRSDSSFPIEYPDRAVSEGLVLAHAPPHRGPQSPAGAVLRTPTDQKKGSAPNHDDVYTDLRKKSFVLCEDVIGNGPSHRPERL